MPIPSRSPAFGPSIVTGLPSTSIVPLSAMYAPARIFISVDLPAPFSPTSACTSPAATSKDTPSSARTPGNDFVIAVIRSKGVSAKAMLLRVGFSERADRHGDLLRHRFAGERIGDRVD